MMQQWQQMPEQQKKLAIVLIAVIVLALVLIIWQLMPRRPATTTQEVAQQPTMGAPVHGAGGQAPGMFEEEMTAPGVGMPSGMIGQAGAPVAPMGGPTMGAPTGVPETVAPTPAPVGKLENPPRPGRPDPFADLPPSGKVSPFTPITLPPTPEPVVLAKAQAGSIGTETFSTQNVETSIPTLQSQSVNLRSYFSPPQPIRTVRELPGWRLAGTILTEGSIGAIVQTPDGRTRAVRLGDPISYGGINYTVTQVDEQKIMLRDSRGEEYTLTRRPAATPPVLPYGGAGGLMPGGFGPFGPGGFAPGGFGPGGFGPGGY